MAVTKYLLSKHSGENLSLLSERFSQDPLENYFGQQRCRGGRSDNPTVQRTLTIANAIRVQKTLALEPVRGNCSRKRRLFETSQEAEADAVNSKPLPKRK